MAAASIQYRIALSVAPARHGAVVVKLPHHRSQIASPIDIGGKNIERRDDDVGIECAARQSKEKERARRRSGGHELGRRELYVPPRRASQAGRFDAVTRMPSSRIW